MTDPNSTFKMLDVPLNTAAFLCCLGARVFGARLKGGNVLCFFDLHVQQWMLDAEEENGIIPYKRYMDKRRKLKQRVRRGNPL